MQRINKLNTLQEAKKELSRLIKAYYRNEVDPVQFRNLIYSFSVLLNFQKTAGEIELDERLKVIESKLEVNT